MHALIKTTLVAAVAAVTMAAASPAEARTNARMLEACEDAIRPGAPMGDVHAAHCTVFDAHGFEKARLQACGYGMGAIYNPIWVDFPMFTAGNTTLIQQNQVFFLHMILMDSESGCAMTLGHSILVNQAGCERLSRHPTGLLQHRD